MNPTNGHSIPDCEAILLRRENLALRRSVFLLSAVMRSEMLTFTEAPIADDAESRLGWCREALMPLQTASVIFITVLNVLNHADRCYPWDDPSTLAEVLRETKRDIAEEAASWG